MKSLKKIAMFTAVFGILGIAGVALAGTVQTPSDIVSGLTGKSAQEIAQDRTAGKSYGTMAKEAGKLDEFQEQMLEQKKALLDQRVKDGTLSQERADSIYNSMKSNQAICDGTGAGARMGDGIGLGRGACGAGGRMGMGRYFR